MEQQNMPDIIAEKTNEKIVLTPEEQDKVALYKSRINLNSKNSIIEYGAELQTKMVSFSETVLSQLRNKDIGSVGDILSGLVADLKSFDKSINKPRILGFFQSLKKKILRIKAEYSKIEKNVVQVEMQLEKHYRTLSKDIILFDKLYEQNEQYFRDLSLYVHAAEEKIAEIRETLLPSLQEKRKANNDLQAEQNYKFIEQQAHQFEKKIHDLKLSRIISLQLAPQLRLVQDNSAVLMERIQSSIVNTLPLWRNQMVLALGLVHSQQALEAQRAVNDATNRMLQRNSEMLRTSTKQIAEENERSIVDIETLRKVNDDLFATIDSVLSVQEDGRRKRLAAEQELLNVETELKKKLFSPVP
ncbi:MAG: toxic anion resistance protein [Candidatus Symbiothrix sp.]|nr:toxic anion resistance protein [Candidatus Symbiothrix sp.]